MLNKSFLIALKDHKNQCILLDSRKFRLHPSASLMANLQNLVFICFFEKKTFSSSFVKENNFAKLKDAILVISQQKKEIQKLKFTTHKVPKSKKE